MKDKRTEEICKQLSGTDFTLTDMPHAPVHGRFNCQGKYVWPELPKNSDTLKDKL